MTSKLPAVSCAPTTSEGSTKGLDPAAWDHEAWRLTQGRGAETKSFWRLGDSQFGKGLFTVRSDTVEQEQRLGEPRSD